MLPIPTHFGTRVNLPNEVGQFHILDGEHRSHFHVEVGHYDFQKMEDPVHSNGYDVPPSAEIHLHFREPIDNTPNYTSERQDQT